MRIATHISDMEVGSQGYTTPWALGFRDEETAYLNSRYSLTSEPFGTSQLLVKRTKVGFEVEITPGCNFYEWEIPTSGAGEWHDQLVTSLTDKSMAVEDRQEVNHATP